ncbi:MAG TPA: tRNA (adenosine(37)-N6)-dimethylallyltransferase MiaA [Gammaproteobacteria bacterium]|nr:tRNA (adenosine(37)-N6)-dimethylallyltransferase MiaA [Gammaproteobacteria bacterium]
MGPTASGKTDLALKLAQRFPFDIISVDSAMIYRGMDIGTAKPDRHILRQAPHRLIDICDPAESYSAARFSEDARREITAIHAAGRIPLLVGGTMLYFRALQHGLAALPEADPEIRLQLQKRLQAEGLPVLYEELQKVDAASAQRIHANDPQRILRALEVFAAAGEPMSRILARSENRTMPWSVFKFALFPDDRKLLHERIEQRFYQMLDAGFVNEVRSLHGRDDLNLDKPSMRTVGYRQIWRHLDGSISYEAMVERGIVATRQLAKRQLTWLRAETGLHSLASINLDLNEVLRTISGFLQDY